MRTAPARLSAAMLLASCAWQLPALAQQDPQLSSDDIVVTAQRRAERLQDVPLAVTAFGEAQLQDRQIGNLVDLMGTVPNLHASNNIGQGTATTVFIRGVGETESIVTIDSPTGFYLDDVFIGRQGVNNMALFDIERLEVLRGPQGTLYGRNTSAGAIKVVTRRPDFDGFEGQVEGRFGRFDTWSLKGSANLPIGENAAVRANVLVSDSDGPMFNRTLDRNVNGSRFAGARLAARLRLSDDVELHLSGDYGRDKGRGLYGVDVAGILRPPSGSIYVASSDTETRNVGEGWGLNGTVEWAISDNAQLKSITAYRETYQQYNLDLTDQAPSLYTLYTTLNARQFSQEFNLTGDLADSRINYTAGLFYFNEKGDSFIGDFIFQSLWLNKDLGARTESYAAYAQANWRISDAVTLIFGGRYTQEDKEVRIVQRFGGTPGFAPGGFVIFDTDTVRGQESPARPGQPVRTELSEGRFTPRLGVELRPNRDLMVFGTWTRGFKSGGWSARVTAADEFIDFDPEIVDSYEIGVRATFADLRGTLNITGFFYDYKNLFSTGTTDDGSFGIATSNAEVKGIELETAWVLADGLRWFLNASWQDAKRKGITNATIVLGDELQRLPPISLSTGLSLDKPVSDRLRLVGAVDFSLTDKHYINPQNTPAALVGPIEMLNATIGIADADDRWQIGIGCRNCLDDRHIVQILDFAALGFTTVYPGERSNWGVTARVRF